LSLSENQDDCQLIANQLMLASDIQRFARPVSVEEEFLVVEIQELSESNLLGPRRMEAFALFNHAACVQSLVLRTVESATIECSAFALRAAPSETGWQSYRHAQ
jgi:hypothetical protein